MFIVLEYTSLDCQSSFVWLNWKIKISKVLPLEAPSKNNNYNVAMCVCMYVCTYYCYYRGNSNNFFPTWN